MKKEVLRKIKNRDYNLGAFDHNKNQIFGDLKRVKFRDLEDMVYRLQLTYDEIVDILDIKYIAGSNRGFTLPPSIY